MDEMALLTVQKHLSEILGRWGGDLVDLDGGVIPVAVVLGRGGIHLETVK